MTDLPVRLPAVPEAAAAGETAKLYAEIREHLGFGFVPDVFQLVSTRPSMLNVFWSGFRSIFDEGVLDREVKELIAALVAREAGCQYCYQAHSLFLELVGARPELVSALESAGIDDLPLEPKVRGLLGLVPRITREAYKITDADFARLREAGWTDDQLLEAVWTACMFNAIVRLADTLGLYHLGQLTAA